jgi:hypothetical protein
MKDQSTALAAETRTGAEPKDEKKDDGSKKQSSG